MVYIVQGYVGMKKFDILRDLGFQQCKAESDIWMWKKLNVYEYIAVYVDDLAIEAIYPGKIINTLKSKHTLSFKGGVGPLAFHLGCDFQRAEDGTLSFGPKKYIEKMKPKEYSCTLEKNDHPKQDCKELLNGEDISTYQSMIGAAQWVISLGHFQIQTAMSQFRIAPRIGQLHLVKRIYGYLKRYKHGAFQVITEKPDLSNFPMVEYNWLYTAYGKMT
jgi:hypothetical protein